MFRVMALASLIMLASCHRQAAAPGDAPTGLAVAPGDGQVTVTWDQQPGLTYWIFYQAGDTVTAAAPGVPLLFDVQSPRVVFPLVNGTQYVGLLAHRVRALVHDQRLAEVVAAERRRERAGVVLLVPDPQDHVGVERREGRVAVGTPRDVRHAPGDGPRTTAPLIDPDGAGVDEGDASRDGEVGGVLVVDRFQPDS